jgi:hypothetical protein
MKPKNDPFTWPFTRFTLWLYSLLKTEKIDQNLFDMSIKKWVRINYIPYRNVDLIQEIREVFNTEDGL